MRLIGGVGYEKFGKKRKLSRDDGVISSIPTIDFDHLDKTCNSREMFDKYQVLLIKGCPVHENSKVESYLQYIFGVCKENPAVIEKTWSMENKGNVSTRMQKPKDFVSTIDRIPSQDSQWYFSFVLQDDQDLLDRFLDSMPIQQPPIFHSISSVLASTYIRKQQEHWMNVVYSSPIWLFCGRNTGSDLNIQGRVEHTDSVSHSGTWHYQLSGKKIWNIRPVEESSEWIQSVPVLRHRVRRDPLRKGCGVNSSYVVTDESNVNRLKVTCEAGDVLVINTRLWWHSTELPPTRDAADMVSISYARDFHLDKDQVENCNMTNVEGLYASRNVSEGNVVLTEEELPDCSLVRDQDANCMVAELEDGTFALIARRDISVGDWLSVLPSDDEDDDNDDN